MTGVQTCALPICFTLSFPIQIPFIYFPSLIAQARASSIIGIKVNSYSFIQEYLFKTLNVPKTVAGDSVSTSFDEHNKYTSYAMPW